MITLVIFPGAEAISWGQFRKSGSMKIALDGFVEGGPRFNKANVVANFNHHEGVDRLATRATCAQVLMAIRMGLFDSFRTSHGPEAAVYVNDCDEDVCTSWFLLRNPALVCHSINPLLNRLVAAEELLDATAGAYPFPADLPYLRELAWIYQPYRIFRQNGGLERRFESEYRSVITDVEHRILRHLAGQGDETDIDMRYTLHSLGGRGWSVVTETGAQARTKMFSDGIRAFVSVRELENNKFAYSLGKMSPFIQFPLEEIYGALNAHEGLSCGGKPRGLWGGSDICGGSPRGVGSVLDPDRVCKIIEAVIFNENAEAST